MLSRPAWDEKSDSLVIVGTQRPVIGIVAVGCDQHIRRTQSGTPGWYYIDANNKAPAWTGVEYFYRFMTREAQNPGPIGFVHKKITPSAQYTRER